MSHLFYRFPRFSLHPFHGMTRFAAQVRDIAATQIAKFDPLKLLPEALPRIQFRRIGRQALQVQPLVRAVREERLYEMTAMNGGRHPK
jgi:hypothetical protein